MRCLGTYRGGADEGLQGNVPKHKLAFFFFSIAFRFCFVLFRRLCWYLNFEGGGLKGECMHTRAHAHDRACFLCVLVVGESVFVSLCGCW